MPTIDILGVPHAYDLTPPSPNPSAPVLIFIHGWLLSRHYWQPLIERLAPDYQCLVYDLRGFGDSQQTYRQWDNEKAQMLSFLSPSPSSVSREGSEQKSSVNSRYTLAAYAEDLSLLLQKLEINQAWLVGHSLGGSIALWGANYCDQIVKGVICLNAGGGIYLKEEFERFRTAGEQVLKRRPRWLSSTPLIDLLFSRMMVSHPLARRWGRQRLIDFVKADGEAALGALLDSTTEAEVHLLPQVVSRLEQPVYFLAGANDKVMEPKYVRHLASFHQLFKLSGDNVLEIPDCGHLSMVEKPDLVVSKIMDILLEHCQ